MIDWNPVTVTAPTATPISVSDMKEVLRVTTTAQDTTITRLIEAATLRAQDYCSRQFVTATLKLQLDGFPPFKPTPLWPSQQFVPNNRSDTIYLLRPPIQSVTSIVYTDENGDSQTFADSKYQVDSDSEPGRIRPVENESWPSTQSETLHTVVVTFVAGYGGASDVDDDLVHAVTMIVANWYEQRSDGLLPRNVQYLRLPHAVEHMLSMRQVRL